MIRSIVLVALALATGCRQAYKPTTAEEYLARTDPEDRAFGLYRLLERDPVPWDTVREIVLHDPSEYVRCRRHLNLADTNTVEALGILAEARSDPSRCAQRMVPYHIGNTCGELTAAGASLPDDLRALCATNEPLSPAARVSMQIHRGIDQRLASGEITKEEADVLHHREVTLDMVERMAIDDPERGRLVEQVIESDLAAREVELAVFTRTRRSGGRDAPVEVNR